MASEEAFCWEARWEVVSEAVTGETAAEGVLMEEEEATAEEEEEETETSLNLAIFSSRSPFPRRSPLPVLLKLHLASDLDCL